MSFRAVLFVTAQSLVDSLHLGSADVATPSGREEQHSDGHLKLGRSSGPYMGFPDEIDISCVVRESANCPSTINARATTHETTALARTLLKSLRRACLGDSWNGHKCWTSMNDFRRLAHTQMKYWASHHGLMQTNSMCDVPPVRHWQSGGGVRANVKCGFNGHEESFFFRHNWKVGGLAIEANLCDNAECTEFRGENDWWLNSRCKQYDDLKPHYHPTLFTFVRDPIAKFVAGYKEMSTRQENVTSYRRLRNATLGTPQHALQFLDAVFHGTCDNPHVLSQAYILMNKACESKFDFIGKLENFEDDWATLSRKGGCTTKLGWFEDPKHESQDPQYKKYEVAMRNALTMNNNALFKALCWWMLPDFAIFDYDLPPECSSEEALHSALSAAREAERHAAN